MEKKTRKDWVRKAVACAMAAVLAASSLLNGGAVAARADQAGETTKISLVNLSYDDNNRCSAYANCHPMATSDDSGELVYCSELEVDGQAGDATIYDLVGAWQRQTVDHDGNKIIDEGRGHTWTQDEVTEVALFQDWVYANYSGDYCKCWGAMQTIIWTYCNSGWSLDDMLTYCGGDTSCGVWRVLSHDEASSAVDYVKHHKSDTVGHGLLYYVNDASQRSIRVWSEAAPQNGKVKVKKVSSNTGITDNNPCYSFEGAEYGVYSDEGCTNQVATLTCDENGDTGEAELVKGTYWVKETKSPKGYKLCTAAHQVEVKANETATATCEEAPQNDPSFVAVTKVDKQSGEAVAQGDGSLAGAVFEVSYWANTEGRTDGEADRTWYLKTDENGTATLKDSVFEDETYKSSEGYKNSDGNNCLPIGTVRIREVAAPSGYTVAKSADVVKVIEGTENEDVESLNNGVYATVDEQVSRGDFSFNKIDAGTQAEMTGVPFLVTSDTTGESHVIVTDENGRVDTSASNNRHTDRTNASDDALSEDKKSIADESKLDASAGVWFSGYADKAVDADDSLGALPHDTYTVTELACSKNRDHNLISFKVTVSRDGKTVDKGTKSDTEVGLSTTLADVDGNKVVEASEKTKLTDTVQFENVKKGSHMLEGELHVIAEDGTDEGIAATASKTFENTVTTGSTTLDFEVDATKLDGKKLVCYEYLDRGTANEASHADPDDEGQTVEVRNPKVSTEAKGDAGDEALAQEKTRLTDTVSYSGLVPGKTYKLIATLHERATADDGTVSDGGELKGADGAAVTKTVEFTPEKSEGTVDVELEVDASALAGKTYVFFESLTRAGKEVATHSDITDEGQDVHFPSVKTNASDKSTGTNEGMPSASTTVTDKVSYTNLTVGKTYKVSGTLHVKNEDGTDGGELKGADGEAVTAEKEFTAEKSDGEVELEFTFDSSALAGKTVVAFEDLTRDGVRVGTHSDITDEDQSVTFETPGTPETPDTPPTSTSTKTSMPSTGVESAGPAALACGVTAVVAAGAYLARRRINGADEA